MQIETISVTLTIPYPIIDAWIWVGWLLVGSTYAVAVFAVRRLNKWPTPPVWWAKWCLILTVLGPIFPLLTLHVYVELLREGAEKRRRKA